MLVDKGEVVPANSSVPGRELLKSESGPTNKGFSAVDYVFYNRKSLLSFPPYKFPLYYDKCTRTVRVPTLHFIHKFHVNDHADIKPVGTEHHAGFKQSHDGGSLPSRDRCDSAN